MKWIGRPKQQFPWSHYILNKDGTARLFNVTTCKGCGCELEAANPNTLHQIGGNHPARTLATLGREGSIKRLEHKLQEGCYSEILEGEVCPSCW